jgi:hypothetical protein
MEDGRGGLSRALRARRTGRNAPGLNAKRSKIPASMPRTDDALPIQPRRVPAAKGRPYDFHKSVFSAFSAESQRLRGLHFQIIEDHVK